MTFKLEISCAPNRKGRFRYEKIAAGNTADKKSVGFSWTVQYETDKTKQPVMSGIPSEINTNAL